MTCVLSTLIYLYVMSLGYANLVCFRVFTLMQMSFISCTHAYFISIEYTMLAWGHISMPSSFALIVKWLYEPSMLKTSSLLHTLGCIIINHQKGGD